MSEETKVINISKKKTGFATKLKKALPYVAAGVVGVGGGYLLGRYFKKRDEHDVIVDFLVEKYYRLNNGDECAVNLRNKELGVDAWIELTLSNTKPEWIDKSDNVEAEF